MMAQTQNLEDPATIPPPRLQTLQETHVNGTPCIFLMGLRRSGKTSAAHVLLHDLPSANTLHLEPTLEPKKYSFESFMNINILELPAEWPSLDPTHACNSALTLAFTNCTTLIWFIDSQDEYLDSLERLHYYILDLLPSKPQLNIEVFIHKCDGVSDDFRHDIYRDIQTRVPEELADANVFNALLTFNQTSVYDKTLHEAFSRVLQKLIPELPTFANLLDSLCANCGFIKAYIFDTKSNLYVASDTTPGSLPIYETCSDYLDTISEFTSIYNWMSRPPYASQYNSGAVPGETGVVTESLITMEKKGAHGMGCREIDGHLMLIYMMAREAHPKGKKALVDFNLGVVVRALRQVLERTEGRSKEARRKEGPWISEEERKRDGPVVEGRRRLR